MRSPLRASLGAVGSILWIGFLVPPFSMWATRYEYVQAIQFSTFAFVVPVLLTSSVQWRRVGLATRDSWHVGDDGALPSTVTPRMIDRIAIARARSSHQQRAVIIALLFAGLTLVWRVAPIVDALIRHPWFSVVEAVSLAVVGVAFFSHLVESPPLQPGASRPYRIGIATGVMWCAWVVAFLNAMAHNSWYTAFHHVAGKGLSLSADQQIGAGVSWFLSAAVFVPIIFWNLIHWLQSEDDPNEELGRLLREERSRGFFGTN